MSDIVERLRTALFDPYGKEAADEIERLRRQLDTAREALRHIASNPTMGEGDMKWRARRALATLDGEDQTDG